MGDDPADLEPGDELPERRLEGQRARPAETVDVDDEELAQLRFQLPCLLVGDAQACVTSTTARPR